jgi:hypothetical protein
VFGVTQLGQVVATGQVRFLLLLSALRCAVVAALGRLYRLDVAASRRLHAFGGSRFLPACLLLAQNGMMKVTDRTFKFTKKSKSSRLRLWFYDHLHSRIGCEFPCSLACAAALPAFSVCPLLAFRAQERARLIMSALRRQLTSLICHPLRNAHAL